MPLLQHLDQVTGLPIRKPKSVRYEMQSPGQPVHVDIKKLSRIPDGGGWRAHGRGSKQDRRAGIARDRAARQGASPSRGYVFLHHAVDDYSRLAYSERLGDERGETAAAFWIRARTFFAEHGITITAVMTDNGACYRSRVFAAALGEDLKHRRTRPFRPQTNGKVERFNRTLAAEWAYARPYASEADREAAYPDWLHHYNHHRPHTGIGGQVPSARVHNLTGKNSALEKAHALEAMTAQLESPRRRERIPQSVRIEVWQCDGGRCTECDSREGLEFDHIIPFAMGGSNTARNLQLLRGDCNRRKGMSLG